MTKQIAIVEDDDDQRNNYAESLERQGYEVITFCSRPVALSHFTNNTGDPPDIAVLDIMLKDEHDGGFVLCRELQAIFPEMPIIFLTARDSDIDRVSGLRLDAWDYLTKPLSPEVLGVRIAALFRITESLRSRKTEDGRRGQKIKTGSLVLDPDTMSIKWENQHLNLTLTEFGLVECLASRPGMVKSYDNLMQVTRQRYVEKNTINGYIRRIRLRFREIDPDFNSIQTVFSVGYKWGEGT